jgi:hypothetical protein
VCVVTYENEKTIYGAAVPIINTVTRMLVVEK